VREDDTAEVDIRCRMCQKEVETPLVVYWWRTTATRSATESGRNVRTLGIP
jgi:hypothetical protein